MIFLRVVRIALIVLGIGAAAIGIILIAVDARVQGGPITASWNCQTPGSGSSAKTLCQTDTATFGGPAGLVDALSYLSLTIGGVALIGAAVAIGQFDRTRIAATPAPPAQRPAGPPPGYGPQPQQGQPGSW